MADKTTFISYSRVDSAFALKLVNDLRSEGQYVWLDQIDIPPGNLFDREIEKTLRASKVLLVVLSPESVGSENVQDEIAFALKNKKRIIPLMHRTCDIPYRIERFQFIDFTKNYQSGLKVLTQVLSTIPVDQTQPIVQPGIVDPPPIIGTHPNPEVQRRKPGSYQNWIKRRGIIAFSAILLITLILYLPGPRKYFMNSDTHKVESNVETDSLVNTKADVDTLNKVPQVSTAIIDTTANKSPIDRSRNSVTKPSETLKIQTKRESRYLGSYPMVFTSENSKSPIACDATGEYAVFDDKVIVKFSNLKFTYLGFKKYPSPYKGERHIASLSMNLVDRTGASWKWSDDSNVIPFKAALMPDGQVQLGSRTFTIPITNVKSLDGFEFNMTIWSSTKNYGRNNVFSKTRFMSPL